AGRRGPAPLRLGLRVRGFRSHAHAREAALAELEHLSVDELRIDVQRPVPDGLPIDTDPTLCQAPACLRGRDPEGTRKQRGQVNMILASWPRHVRDLRGRAMLDVDTVEFAL